MKDSWESGNSYEYYVGRWSRPVARTFLSWLAPNPSLRWLDVGCGTGALTESILTNCRPAQVIGVDPSGDFLSTARKRLGGRAEFRQGNAYELPLADSAVHMTVSGLVLNFVPDALRGLIEMKRATEAGGTVATYVWDYAGKMEFMRYFWDSAVDIDSSAAHLDEGARFPICQPDELRKCFEGAGLTEVEVTPIEIETHFGNFDDYWNPFLGGQGPAPTYVMSLDEGLQAELRETIRARLPMQDDESISLVARAWAVRGKVSA